MTDYFDSLNQAYAWVCRTVMASGQAVSPRSQPTKELLNFSFGLRNPRARLIEIPQRRWSFPLALGELCWHLSADTAVGPLAYYAPRWRSFAVNGHIVGSAYGSKIFSDVTGQSQWAKVKSLLRSDPDTRRAILVLVQPVSAELTDPDQSCTAMLQFFLRNGRLHGSAIMRSNDVFLGLPYDVFLFTFLQELMAVELGCGLGSYFHYAASMHAYGRDFERVTEIANSQARFSPSMAPLVNIEELDDFIAAEREIRRDGKTPALQSPYWSELAKVLEYFRASKDGNDFAVSLKSASVYGPILS